MGSLSKEKPHIPTQRPESFPSQGASAQSFIFGAQLGATASDVSTAVVCGCRVLPGTYREPFMLLPVLLQEEDMGL